MMHAGEDLRFTEMLDSDLFDGPLEINEPPNNLHVLENEQGPDVDASSRHASEIDAAEEDMDEVTDDDIGEYDENDGSRDQEDPGDVISVDVSSNSFDDGTEDGGAWPELASAGSPHGCQGICAQPGKSSYRGVCYDKKKRKWRVQIKVRLPNNHVCGQELSPTHPLKPPLLPLSIFCLGTSWYPCLSHHVVFLRLMSVAVEALSLSLLSITMLKRFSIAL